MEAWLWTRIARIACNVDNGRLILRRATCASIGLPGLSLEGDLTRTFNGHGEGLIGREEGREGRTNGPKLLTATARVSSKEEGRIAGMAPPLVEIR